MHARTHARTHVHSLDELQGKGAWGKMFITAQTDLVAHTDLYRLTPYCGLCPKSIGDIEAYFNHKPKAKKKSQASEGG